MTDIQFGISIVLISGLTIAIMSAADTIAEAIRNKK